MGAVLPDLPIGPVLEVAGVFVGSMSGALAAVRKQFDVFGVLVLAWAAGLGGGVLRDLLIGAVPPVGISDVRLMAAALAGGLVMYFGHPRLERARRFIIVLDAGALALFSVVGTVKGLEYGTTALAAVVVGVLTGVGGGMLRDLLTGEVPVVLHQRELYAVPALLGSAATVGLWHLGWAGAVGLTAVAAGIFALRLVALRFRLTAPGPWRGGRSSGSR
ncbi:trimeric intracellular cation channel family protein [Cellulomonas sp. S1-8]|uniref:trimeric intracellular cation channel family protein n=1 Tax=Cellulomonas sp. S1-8 TaxID=2904790 RepID=UPI002242DDAA|nr:TRIC cation channel family protein [Cellulomonas sp. S1-8]UZN05315.1 TRIC cation channel family protein [Cellulomonas sp. S1-8]